MPSCHFHRSPALEPEVQRRQREQRHDEHHAEMVRVARERVRPVDARAVHRSVDVDRARAAGQRRKHRRVEVVAGARAEQLQHAVHAVREEAGAEPAERAPVIPLAAPHEVRDRRDQEEEVQDVLHHPLRELVERLLRLEVEVAEQIHEQERREEAEHDRRRARHRAPARQREREQEEHREHVGDAERCPRRSSAPSRR